ncbi:hypothetical protein [Methylosinus sp. Ce-a6]|uniref:hypothetical protein n=1 Tax=Methylosinus sp. Ce-a6 TaxID=2172005 RepID=UPI00135CC178|nr:hypothetical protein [Methylosinus sp. Ce-a6]
MSKGKKPKRVDFAAAHNRSRKARAAGNSLSNVVERMMAREALRSPLLRTTEPKAES